MFISGLLQFVVAHLESENSSLHYVQYKAEVQVVAGLIYTLKYRGNDESGACKVSEQPLYFVVFLFLEKLSLTSLIECLIRALGHFHCVLGRVST